MTEHLITKLLLDPSLVGRDTYENKAALIDTFWNEHSDFWERISKFNKYHIWIIAKKPDELTHMWKKVFPWL